MPISTETLREAIAALEEKNARCRASFWNDVARRTDEAAIEMRLEMLRREQPKAKTA